MNARIIFSMIAAAGMLLATTGMSAQEVATKKEYKKIEKHEKFLNKQVKDRAIRDARKEARKLEKQGYKAPVGKLRSTSSPRHAPPAPTIQQPRCRR